MADVKITDLTALGGAAASGDLLEVTDISGPDVSRKATVAEIVNKTVMQAAGAAFDTDFSSANSILLATTANTPAVLAFAASTLLGRGASGNAGALTKAQVLTLLNVADGANNYSHPNHTGDVTSVADGAQTIVAGVVTLAKMANMATDSFIGRDTAGTGVPEVLSSAAVRVILGIEAGATADQSDAEIKTAYEANADTNEFSDAEQTLLGNQSGTNTGDEASASLTVEGIVERATQTEVDTGTDISRYVTPETLAAFTGFNLYTHPNHTGDVTSTGDGATVIANSAVTLAKMADMASASFLGHDGSPTSSPQVLSKAAALTVLNVEDGADVTDAINVATAGAPLLSSDNAFSGINTNSAQPAFLVTNSVTDTNVTGSTLVATVEFDTEIFDQGGDFNNATDTFTAPVDGKYLLTTHVRLTDVVSATQVIFQINTSNRTYRTIEAAAGATNDWSGKTFSISVPVDMDANDTATVSVNIDGMVGNTADISGHVTILDTMFSGALLF